MSQIHSIIEMAPLNQLSQIHHSFPHTYTAYQIKYLNIMTAPILRLIYNLNVLHSH